jgi:hypothetical protein
MGTDFTGKMNFGPGLAVDFPKTAPGLKIEGLRYAFKLTKKRHYSQVIDFQTCTVEITSY